jgi:hypothetical protein
MKHHGKPAESLELAKRATRMSTPEGNLTTVPNLFAIPSVMRRECESWYLWPAVGGLLDQPGHHRRRSPSRTSNTVTHRGAGTQSLTIGHFGLPGTQITSLAAIGPGPSHRGVSNRPRRMLARCLKSLTSLAIFISTLIVTNRRNSVQVLALPRRRKDLARKQSSELNE